MAINRPIRVLQFLNANCAPGGVETHVCALLTRLPEDEFTVTLVCPPIPYEFMFARQASNGHRVICLDAQRFSQIGAMKKLASILRREQIDIAHCHQFRATTMLAPLATACRVPCVIETTHLREAWRRGWIKRSFVIDRMVYKLVDHFIAVSDANRQYLVRQKHCDPSTIDVIRNGCDLSRFQPSPDRGASIRERYGVPPSALLVVYAGRLEPQKGIGVLLEAMTPVASHFPDVRVLLVGDGALRAELKAETYRRNLRSAITFAGLQRDVVPFLDAADLVVLPSFWEGLPFAAVEAGAMGKPMVATAVDGTPEVVKDGESGLLVPPGDSNAFANAMISLLGDAPKRRAMGARAKEIVAARFSVERLVAETTDLYKRLMDHRVRTRSSAIGA